MSYSDSAGRIYLGNTLFIELKNFFEKSAYLEGGGGCKEVPFIHTVHATRELENLDPIFLHNRPLLYTQQFVLIHPVISRFTIFATFFAQKPRDYSG